MSYIYKGLPSNSIPAFSLPIATSVVVEKTISELAAEKVHNTTCWSKFNSRIRYYEFLVSNQNAGWFNPNDLPSPPTVEEFNDINC